MEFLVNSSDKSGVVITGGGSGIGLALAKLFAKQGHEVMIVGRTLSKLEDAKRQSPSLKIHQVDISKEEDRVEFVNFLKIFFPQLNVLVNNAGLFNIIPSLLDVTDINWDTYVLEANTNVCAPIHLTMMLLPHLAKQKNALIVNVSSIGGFFPTGSGPTYNAGKGTYRIFKCLTFFVYA